MRFKENNGVLKLIESWNGRKYGAISNFAKEVGSHRMTVYKKISSEYTVHSKEIEKWSNVLGVDLNEETCN